MKKWSDLQIPLQLSFKLQWPFATHCNSMYFYKCGCYESNCMSCNECNSSYVKLNTYAIHVTQLQLCKNNCYVTSMSLICNYHGNVVMMSILIIYQSLTRGIMGILGENYYLFEILISTIHYDYIKLWHVA
jgi:hypothetical protein